MGSHFRRMREMELKDQFKDMEEMWVRQAVDGDLDAFNQLVLKHQDLAYRHALLMLNDGSWQMKPCRIVS
jgi:hypothetical protein